jgi:UDP-3-O-[3-hydroxymyristoyl] glucosamine N-acyltransferase
MALKPLPIIYTYTAKMNAKSNQSYSLKQLIHGLDVKLQGDDHCLITGIAAIEKASPGHLCFLINSRYRKYLATTKASAVILTAEDAPLCHTNAIICHNPHYIYALIAQHFKQRLKPVAGIHDTVVIGQDCQIAKTASIGPYVVLGDRVTIGEHCIIGSHCRMGHDVSIGDRTTLATNVSLYDFIHIGQDCRMESGVVIGSEGFGFAMEKGQWHAVPQLGGVVIGNRVSIGANTTIDCGAVGDTVIEDGVKLDNLIQVGHNVHIGQNTIIAGCVGIAGSAHIGKYCMIGGASGIGGHINIADHVIITGMTAVSKSIREPGIYSSGVGGLVSNHVWRKNSARFQRLESVYERLKALESSLNELKER